MRYYSGLLFIDLIRVAQSCRRINSYWNKIWEYMIGPLERLPFLIVKRWAHGWVPPHPTYRKLVGDPLDPDSFYSLCLWGWGRGGVALQVQENKTKQNGRAGREILLVRIVRTTLQWVDSARSCKKLSLHYAYCCTAVSKKDSLLLSWQSPAMTLFYPTVTFQTRNMQVFSHSISQSLSL